MASRRYLNFDLLLEQEGEGRYQARVTDSPLGETPSVRFQLPFDATTLENLLLKLDPGRSGTRRVGATGQQQAAMDFGGPLYQAVFTGDLALAWQRSLDQARAEQAGGLRLRLRLNDAPAIAGLPWELLYDARSNNFIAQSERTPVVRFLDVPQVPRPIAVDGPLRVLAIISSPVDLEELDVEAEWRRIGEALAPRVQAGLVVVDRLPSATLADLGAWLRRQQTHVIHFVGHGDFDDQLREGVIYFQDQHGRSSPVTSSVLGPYLRDHDPLRMVVLNACRSARTDAVDPFGGMAQGLVQQDAQAVVAMQFPISDRAAVTFTGEFYGALVDGLPVDQAVSSARKALLADFRDEWPTPVLFLRSPDGNIFENVHAVAGGVPDEAPAPTPHPGPRPDPPGPTFWKMFVLRVRKSPKAFVAAAVAVVVVALVAGLVWLLPFGDDGTRATDDPTDGPIAEFPRSAPLPDDQMLVAASKPGQELGIWVIDVDDPSQSRDITLGVDLKWLPVLGPDRDTMIFSQLKPQRTRDYELWVATAATGERAAPLPIVPAEECADHAGRPAWSQAGDPEDWFFVLRCRAAPNALNTLMKVDMRGVVTPLVLENPETGQNWKQMGDPTISPDGSTVVVFVTDDTKAEAGSLYGIDLTNDNESFELLKSADERPREFSDPVFSPSLEETRIAFRRADPETGFDVWTGVIEAGQLVDLKPLAATDATEEDPSFSPEGTQVAFTRIDSEDTSVLLRVDIAGGDPIDIELPEGIDLVKVPAWTTR